MGITKVSALFAANVDRTKAEQVRRQTQETSKSEGSPADEAVTYTPSFGGGGDDESVRAARIAALKSQVASGSYKPNSNDVATAVARDLF